MNTAAAQSQATPLSPEREDAALVAQYRAGAEAAFAELVRRHQIPVFRLLLGMTSDADQAELFCEQVFFEAARRIVDLPEGQAIGSWLLGLSREVVRKAEEKRPKSTAPRRIGPRPREPKALVKHEVRTALTDLSGDERVALILADLEGDSLEDIASTLGTTADEAEKIVATARAKFEEGMERGNNGAPQTDDRPRDGLLEPGTLLDRRFRIESLLGKGGMGAVYRAIDTQTGDAVALKTLLPASEKDPALRRRFAREAEVIQRLQHPNFVRLIHYGEREGEPSYVAMELLDGHALNQVLERETRLAPRRALHIVQQMLHGLSYAHEQGVIHRDLKPENVMLLRDAGADFPKLLDLGIAKLVGTEDARRTRLTQQNELLGTPLYISPEMLRGEPLDARADLYSLTVVLYEMLASRPPFDAKTSTALFAMHLVSPPPPLSEVAPELSVAPLEQLLQLGLAKDPGARIPSAESYARRIEELLRLDWENLPKVSRSAATVPPAAKRARKSSAAGVAGVDAVVAEPGRRRWPSVALAVALFFGLAYWLVYLRR